MIRYAFNRGLTHVVISTGLADRPVQGQIRSERDGLILRMYTEVTVPHIVGWLEFLLSPVTGQLHVRR